jgi:hypothetical protein
VGVGRQRSSAPCSHAPAACSPRRLCSREKRRWRRPDLPRARQSTCVPCSRASHPALSYATPTDRYNTQRPLPPAHTQLCVLLLLSLDEGHGKDQAWH